jgi:hypothetical protein
MGDSQERETSILGGGANPWNLINCPVLGFSVCLLITTINRKQGAPGLNNTFVRKRGGAERFLYQTRPQSVLLENAPVL